MYPVYFTACELLTVFKSVLFTGIFDRMRKAIITSLVSCFICLSSINSAAEQAYTYEEWRLFLDWLSKNYPVYIEGDERPFRYFSQHLMFPEYEMKQKPSIDSYSGIGFSGDIFTGFPKAINPELFGDSAIELAL